jgi:hypothetical protein
MTARLRIDSYEIHFLRCKIIWKNEALSSVPESIEEGNQTGVSNQQTESKPSVLAAARLLGLAGGANKMPWQPASLGNGKPFSLRARGGLDIQIPRS